MPYATWGTRLGGYLIDLLIFLPVLIVLYFAFRNMHVLQVHLNMKANGHRRRDHFSLLSFILTSVALHRLLQRCCAAALGVRRSA